MLLAGKITKTSLSGQSIALRSATVETVLPVVQWPRPAGGVRSMTPSGDRALPLPISTPLCCRADGLSPSPPPRVMHTLKMHTLPGFAR